MSLYEGSTIILTTMHGKEKYIKPSCAKILKANLVVQDKINTDLLGTFSGEIERKGSQKEVALKKCYLGLEVSGENFGVASEGSFGMHPFIPFAKASFETLVFVDKKNQLEIFENKMFKETNFNHQITSSLLELEGFLKKIQFPSHGVIVKPQSSQDKNIVFKGIQTISDLEKAINLCVKNSPDSKAHVETDMRCHMNPTRGLNIRNLAILLFRRLTRFCPKCNAIGWGKTGFKGGKPCIVCDAPTKLLQSYTWSCAKCLYEEEKTTFRSSEKASPIYCDMCNP